MLAEGGNLEELIAAAHLCADNGHANLPASLGRLIANGTGNAPKGFAGIRAFLEELG